MTDDERRDRRKEVARKEYEKNRSRYIERARASVERRKLEVSEYHKQWRAKNREYKAEQDRLWRARNPAKVNRYGNDRRARKLRAMPAWLSAIQSAQIEEFYDIAKALTVQTGTRHDVDHIHPLNGRVFCGLHVPWNLQILPRIENARKGVTLPCGRDIAVGVN